MVVYYSKNSSRNFHTLIDNIANYLKKNGATIEASETPSITYKDNIYNIWDCELLIHYPETDTFKGISFADYHSPLTTFFIERNNANDVYLCSQYGNTNLYNRTRTGEFSFNLKWKPSIYTPSYPYVSLDDFYLKRSLKSSFIDKFIFRGNNSEHSRTSARLLRDNEYFEGPDYIPGPVENYFDSVIDYKVGLSLPGTGELCYRDVEYMALGIPFMKLKYVTDLNPPLIPNFHYICIDRIEAEEDYNYNGGLIAKERLGGEEYVEAYLKKFLEVKDNDWFLNFISKNARKYYETYLHPLTKMYHVLNLLEINTSI
jgi:hypothetical protein